MTLEGAKSECEKLSGLLRNQKNHGLSGQEDPTPAQHSGTAARGRPSPKGPMPNPVLPDASFCRGPAFSRCPRTHLPGTDTALELSMGTVLGAAHWALAGRTAHARHQRLPRRVELGLPASRWRHAGWGPGKPLRAVPTASHPQQRPARWALAPAAWLGTGGGNGLLGPSWKLHSGGAGATDSPPLPEAGAGPGAANALWEEWEPRPRPRSQEHRSQGGAAKWPGCSRRPVHQAWTGGLPEIHKPAMTRTLPATDLLLSRRGDEAEPQEQ